MSLEIQQSPDPPILAFFDFFFFVCFPIFLALLWGSAKRKTLAFLGETLAFSKKSSGWRVREAANSRIWGSLCTESAANARIWGPPCTESVLQIPGFGGFHALKVLQIPGFGGLLALKTLQIPGFGGLLAQKMLVH